MVEEDQVTNIILDILAVVHSLVELVLLDILVVDIMLTTINTGQHQAQVAHLDIMDKEEVLAVWRVSYVSGTLDNYVKRLH
tara:strand:- start:1487 stop:1729 length:243 start_codon:yes stop_codon:yes gene_type:complete